MTLFEKFKKTWLLIVLCLLLTACGADAPAVPANPPEEPSVETPTETPEESPVETPVEPPVETAADEGTTQPAKIRLDGEIIPWDQFPIPEPEAFGLTGEDASLYKAAVSQFNREETPGYFYSDGTNTDMILPAVNVLGEYTTDEGNTACVVNFVKCFFFDLGSGLADLDNPVYTTYYMGSLASFTLDHDGNLVSFDECGDGEDDSAPYRVCGPLTDIAEKYLAPGGNGWEEGMIRRVPDVGSYEEMLQQYLNYYFEK